MMFNTDLYEKEVRERHKGLQREMEHLRLLASLHRPSHSLGRHMTERVGIFLIKPRNEFGKHLLSLFKEHI